MPAPDTLNVTAEISIPRAELSYKATRAGGSGGQHVNTSSTRIELLWDVRHTTALPEELRERVAAKLASRLDSDGLVRVVASTRRSQGQNKEAADSRLAELVGAALVVPKKRKPTRPSKASKEKRLDSKKKHSRTKAGRRSADFD
jgi:ribosome-associated protein